MMRPCNKCLENRWSFQHNEGWIVATCDMCGNEVEFEKREKEKMKEGCLCRKCKKGIIMKKEAKKKNIYSAYYYCPQCREMYMSDDFKL